MESTLTLNDFRAVLLEANSKVGKTHGDKPPLYENLVFLFVETSKDFDRQGYNPHYLIV